MEKVFYSLRFEPEFVDSAEQGLVTHTKHFSRLFPVPLSFGKHVHYGLAFRFGDTGLGDFLEENRFSLINLAIFSSDQPEASARSSLEARRAPLGRASRLSSLNTKSPVSEPRPVAPRSQALSHSPALIGLKVLQNLRR